MDLTEQQQRQFLVKKFLKSEKPNWPREIKIAKKLLSKASFQYWENLDIGFKFNSLAFFLSAQGVFLLNKLKNKPKLDSLVKKADNVEIEPELVNQIKVRPKTVADFIKCDDYQI